MSLLKFLGDPKKGGIPRGSGITIVSLPDQQIVFQGIATDAAYIDLDPGKYKYRVLRLTGTKAQHRRLDDVAYGGEILHEVDEASWAELSHLAPQMCSPITTNEGCRWVCRIYNCGNRATTSISALIHEVVDHIGIPREEFLAAPQEVGRKAARGYQTLAASAPKPGQRPAAMPPASAPHEDYIEGPAIG